MLINSSKYNSDLVSVTKDLVNSIKNNVELIQKIDDKAVSAFNDIIDSETDYMKLLAVREKFIDEILSVGEFLRKLMAQGILSEENSDVLILFEKIKSLPDSAIERLKKTFESVDNGA